MVMNEAANEAAAAAAAAATIEIGNGDIIGRGNKNDHWLRNLSKFLSAMEDEGLLGLAQSVFAKSTDIVASVASSAVGTAIHVVSSSGAAHFVDGPQNHVWNEEEENEEEDENRENLVSRTKCSSENEVAYHDPAITTLHHCRDESHHRQRDNSPFGIFSIASTIANIMLGAISPLLVQQRQHHHTHYSHRCNVVEAKDRKLLKKYDGTTSSSKEPIFLHAEMNPSDERFDLRQFLDANESCCRSSSSRAESVYYDATSSTRSLSTTDSFVSSDDADEKNSDDKEDHIGEVEISGHDHTNFPQHVVMPEQKESTNNASTNTTQNFYLDVTDLLSKEERDILISTCNECIVCKDSSTFYVVSDSIERNETFRRVLDILVERSLSIAQIMDDGCSSPLRNEEVDTNHGEFCWKPDDRTKKYLERQQRNNFTVEEWTHILETEVLKWTSSDRNSNCPMLKTRGIIDMSPLKLKELLLDCQRNHLYNKNAISKTNMHCFADIFEIGGETKIVQNVMKIPIVGGAIQIVSLTHVRCIENGGFILVSQSVGDNANTNPANPYYSISILRSISNNEQKTELTNITQISSMPIPKFLMQKVGLMGATDFFNNLRSLCN